MALPKTHPDGPRNPSAFTPVGEALPFDPGPAGGTSRAPLLRRHVLMVEAEEVYARKARYVLEQGGHTVSAVQDVTGALLTLRKRVPDVLLVDVNLPLRGAETLFKHVRGEEASRHVPFLFTARGGHPLEIVKGIPLDPRAVLKKPFSARKLREHLQTVFQRLELIEQLGGAESFRGQFSDLDLYDLMGLLTYHRRTGLLSVLSQDKKQQAIARFQEGQLISARCGFLMGQDVFVELMLWDSASFEFRPSVQGNVPPVRSLPEEQWREILESLELVDRSRLNPFPRHLVVTLQPEDVSTASPGWMRAEREQTDELMPEAILASDVVIHGKKDRTDELLPESIVMPGAVIYGRRDRTDELLPSDILPPNASLPDLPVLSLSGESPVEELVDSLTDAIFDDTNDEQTLDLDEVVYHDADDSTFDLDPLDIIDEGMGGGLLGEPLEYHMREDEGADLPFVWETEQPAEAPSESLPTESESATPPPRDPKPA